MPVAHSILRCTASQTYGQEAVTMTDVVVWPDAVATHTFPPSVFQWYVV